MSDDLQEFTLKFHRGDPAGVCVANIDDWHTGVVLLFPRRQHDQVSGHDILNEGNACVYLLRQEEHNKAKPKVYIGSTDEFHKRIKDHIRKKDWWTEVVVIAFIKPITKTAAQFLEARMLQDLRRNTKIELDNKTDPRFSYLDSSAEKRIKEEFRRIKEILPLLQINDFKFERSRPHPTFPLPKLDAQILKIEIEMEVPVEGGLARAIFYHKSRKTIVQRGSHARGSWTSTKKSTSEEFRRKQLIDEGILKESKIGNSKFIKNAKFDSPSGAAAVVSGTPVNGYRAWKVRGSNETLGERLGKASKLKS